ncbi:MAG TPA: choice-of-anchor tandem repeat GloVer-containing protein, partial [Candidatus Cybelea sp.]
GFAGGCSTGPGSTPATSAARARNASANESVLYSFENSPDGSTPTAGLVQNSSGVFFGTTELGGNHSSSCGTGGCGTVFKMTPDGFGYRERVIYRFGGPRNLRDGASPSGGLVIGADGALYGTTYAGGEYGQGLVFKLTLHGSRYRERPLCSFSGNDGAYPFAGLTGGPGRILYGTTAYGGAGGGGTVFKLSPVGGKLTVLHSFGSPYSNGAFPSGPVTLDADGAIYGATEGGGWNGRGWRSHRRAWR